MPKPDVIKFPNAAERKFDTALVAFLRAGHAARTQFASIFPAGSEEDRALAADAMPGINKTLLQAFDDLFRTLNLEADGWIGGVFGERYGRKAIATVASTGYELESFDSDYHDAAERLRAAAGLDDDGEAA